MTVPRFRLTNAAEGDLIEIGRYTRERWGQAQYRRYLARLDDRFRMLAENPDTGIASDECGRIIGVVRKEAM